LEAVLRGAGFRLGGAAHCGAQAEADARRRPIGRSAFPGVEPARFRSPALPRSGARVRGLGQVGFEVGEGLGHVFAAVAETDVAGFVVDGAG